MRPSEKTKLEKRLEDSIQKVEAIWNDPANRGPGERLDASRLKKVAAEMEAKARKLRASGVDPQD